jgi:hypothetical protein
MHSRVRTSSSICVFALQAGAWLLAGGAAVSSAASPPEFERDVLPILAAHCLHCHGGLVQENKLDLRTLASLERGGESGAALMPGSLDESLIWQKISTDEMPTALLKVSAAEKATIKAWIEAKAPRSTHWREIETTPPAEPRKPDAVAKDIDDLIAQRLKQLKLQPAPLARDEEFLRRVSLDVHGRLPEPERIRTFAASTDADKRAKLVDELLADPQYGQHFALVWHHRLLPLNEGRRNYNQAFIDWLAKHFNDGHSWQAVVTELITATGPSNENAAVAFLVNPTKEVDKLSSRAARLFLGMHMECAECHDHPLKLWKQKDDYWALAAFFTGLKLEKKRDVLTAIDAAPRLDKQGKHLPLEANIPSTALVDSRAKVFAGFPGGGPAADLQPPYRAALASWMTSADNDYFAAATANRWWAHFFGRGLVDPVDDLHDGNPATHPELLRMLADELVAAKFDVRHLVRSICLSQAYQRTSEGLADTESQVDFYGRMPTRSLSPDVLYTILGQAFESPDLPLPLVAPPPEGKRPVIPTMRELFANSFPPNEDHNPQVSDHAVLRVLQFMNWDVFNQGGKIVPRLIEAKLEPEAMLDELYLCAFSRLPTEDERQKILAYTAAQSDPQAAWSSVLWMLVNSSQFVLNH